MNFQLINIDVSLFDKEGNIIEVLSISEVKDPSVIQD